jgi:FAD-dependent oxidoreductase domain-containing protein 1
MSAMTSVSSADAVIVGGGIIGSAIAYYLSTAEGAAQRRVVIVERDTGYAQASTGRSAGGLRQQFSTPENIAMSRATLELFRRLEAAFGSGAEVGFRERGYLLLAAPEREPLLTQNVSLQRAQGADILLLKGWELARRFQWLAMDGVAAGGFGASGEGWFDPPSLAALMRAAARARGVAVVHDTVIGIDVANQVEAVTLARGGRLPCRYLINAAGPWAGELAALAGIWLPVTPRKRYVYVIDCRNAPEVLHQAPLTVDVSGAWFRPEGRVFLCGKSPAFDQEPPARDLDQIDHEFFTREVWPCLAARVPAFEAVKVVNAWAGYYDTNTLDHNAVIGAHPQLQNFYFANGFSGHGAQQSAAAGRAIAELIVHGTFKTIDLRRFGYARVAHKRPLAEQNVI